MLLACGPRTLEVEAGGSEVQGHAQLCREFESSLNCEILSNNGSKGLYSHTKKKKDAIPFSSQTLFAGVELCLEKMLAEKDHIFCSLCFPRLHCLSYRLCIIMS